MLSRYAFLQRECHRLLNEVFESKSEGYKWLNDNYNIVHFHNFHHQREDKKSLELLEEIYSKLYIKSLLDY